jgi:protease-4
MRRSRVIVLGILAVSLLSMSAGLFLMLRPRGIPDRSLLEIRLSESLPEERTRGVLGRFLGWREVTVHDLVKALDGAAREERVQAVTLRLGGLRCGFARVQEVRQAITRLRESGKYVGALLERGGLADYYLATAADEVFLLPGGSLDVTGVVFEVPFARGTLDRLGVVPDFVVIGEYKGSPEVYTRYGMSSSMRDNLGRLADSFYARLTQDLASRRGLTEEQLREITDAGFLAAGAAVELGLVDDLLHADGLRERVEERAGGELEDLDLFELLDTLGPGWFSRPPRLALVHVTGALVRGESVDNDWYGRMAGSETLSRVLEEVRDDEGIEAVVLRIDSPGGSAAASEILWRQVEQTAGEKPVVVSMGDYAASGAYYVAVAADELVAQPSTLTGSLGVFGGKFALKGLYDWIGLNWEQVKRGRNADMFLDLEPWTAEQRDLIREHLEGIYRRFLTVIAAGREMSQDEARALADGRIFSGEEARRLGLVDQIGGLREAIDAARRRAGLDPGQTAVVEIYPRPKGWLSGLVGGASLAAGSPATGPVGEALREAAVLDAVTRDRIALYCPYRLKTP